MQVFSLKYYYSNSFRNPRKVKVFLYVLYMEEKVLYMEEKMISIDTRTPQGIRYMWMLHNKKEN